MARRGGNTVNADNLPIWTRDVIAIIRETGAIGLACIVVAFYLGQQAGWIGDISVQGHHELAAMSQRQTEILSENQRILKSIVDNNERNSKSFIVLARGICLSVTISKDIEARCLAGMP
jgi:hypothetical protein